MTLGDEVVNHYFHEHLMVAIIKQIDQQNGFQETLKRYWIVPKKKQLHELLDKRCVEINRLQIQSKATTFWIEINSMEQLPRFGARKLRIKDCIFSEDN